MTRPLFKGTAGAIFEPVRPPARHLRWAVGLIALLACCALLAPTAAEAQAPGAPTEVSATKGDTRVRLKWTPAAGSTAATGFEYQRKTQASGCTFSASDTWTAISGGAAARVYVVEGLTNATRYCFRVRGKTSSLDGTPSAAVSATPATNSAATGAPSIDGTPQVGMTLTAKERTPPRRGACTRS